MVNSGKSELLLVVVTVLTGLSWIFSKEAVLLMPPLLFMALRFALAGLILGLIGWRQLSRMNAEMYWRSVKVGVVFGLAMSFWILGLHFGTHLGEGAFLTSLGVVMVPLVARLVFKETPPSSTWVALPVAASGLALLSLEGGFKAEPGQLFYVASACLFALFLTLNSRAANDAIIRAASGQETRRQRVPALALTTVVLFTVGLVTGAGSLLLEDVATAFADFTTVMFGWIVASATLGTAMRFFVQTYAQSLTVHSHGVVILVLEPIWTALFAALWFGETMSAIQIAGCLMIFMSLVVNRWSSVRRLLRAWL